MPTTTLQPLSGDGIDAVVDLAVREATPTDVMPSDDHPDPAEWTPGRRVGFAAFLRSRLAPLPDGRSESSFVVLADGRVAGVARLLPSPEDPGAYETGLWLGRNFRGQGVGEDVLAHLVEHVRETGGTAVVADTTTGNAGAIAVLRRHGAGLVPDPHDPAHVRARIIVR